MKRIFSIIVLLVAIATSFTMSAESRWGVVAGVNVNAFPAYQRGDYKLYDTSNTIGGTVGINGEIFFPGIGMGVDASLLYDFTPATLQLGQREIWASQGIGEEKIKMHILEIPLNLKYRYINLNGIENKIYPFVFGGPSINFLLAHSDGGNMAYTTTSLGMHVGFGVELMRKFQISASHEWGLSQQFKTILLEDNAHKLRTWHIRCTYFF